MNSWIEVVEVQVPASQPTLPQQSLWDWVQWSQLAIVPYLRIKCFKHFPKGNEFGVLFVYVFPVDLVRDNYQLVFNWKLNHLGNGVSTENGASGVARINNDDGFDFLSTLHRFLVCPLELGEVKLPPSRFVKVVFRRNSSVEWYTCSVERVLRNGNHDGVILIHYQRAQQKMYSLGCALSKKDIVSWRWLHSIHLGDISAHTLTHQGNAQWMRVAPRTYNLIQHSLGPCPRVGIHQLVGEQVGVEYAGDYFSEEGDGFLVKFLRVANIAECNLIERIL